MKSILDSSFRYTPSFATDVRKTFERIRREQQAQSQEERLAQISPAAPVSKVIVRAVPEHSPGMNLKLGTATFGICRYVSANGNSTSSHS
jgi:hypothetical protein